MIDSKISELEEKIKKDPNINPETKKELLRNLADLKSEICNLPETNKNDAKSIEQFTEILIHETTREDKKPNLIKHAVDGLLSSIEGFETSHPKLADTVNLIAETLSNMGI